MTFPAIIYFYYLIISNMYVPAKKHWGIIYVRIGILREMLKPLILEYFMLKQFKTKITDYLNKEHLFNSVN
jgi:hypothetical protein